MSYMNYILSFLLNLARQWKAVRLDFVSYRYPERSIKKEERAKKAVEERNECIIYNPNQSLPRQWKNL